MEDGLGADSARLEKPMQFICNYLPRLCAQRNETGAYVRAPADAFSGNTNAFPHLSATNIGFSRSLNVLEVCRGGGDPFVHTESGRDLPLIYPETISHTQSAAHGRRRLKLALLSGCHTASCARSQPGERRLWGFWGRVLPSLCSPQHPFDVSAAFGVLRAPVRKRDSFPSFHHPCSSFRVFAHQSKCMQTARLINIPPVPPRLHEHTACLIKITEASEPPPP